VNPRFASVNGHQKGADWLALLVSSRTPPDSRHRGRSPERIRTSRRFRDDIAEPSRSRVRPMRFRRHAWERSDAGPSAPLLRRRLLSGLLERTFEIHKGLAQNSLQIQQF
jgi:hypothetical protein